MRRDLQIEDKSIAAGRSSAGPNFMIRVVRALILATAVLFGAGEHLFGTNGRPVLCIPTADLDPSLISYADELLYLRPGSGHTPGFSFSLSPAFMKAHIDGFVVLSSVGGSPYVNAFTGTVSFLGKDDRIRFGPAMRARTVEDAWKSQGECVHPDVEPLAQARLFKIRCSKQASYSELWNRAPDSKQAMPDPNRFVVATCNLVEFQQGPNKTTAVTRCARVITIGSFLVDYWMTEENSQFYPQLDEVVREKISEWKRNC